MSSPNRTSIPGRRRVAARLLGERGAAAVEFALVAPVLLLLLVGIIQFSLAMHNKAALSEAAREGAREMALTNDVAKARAAVQAADGRLNLGNAQITVSPTSCVSTSTTRRDVTVSVRYHQSALGGLAGFDLTGQAVMRCGG